MNRGDLQASLQQELRKIARIDVEELERTGKIKKQGVWYRVMDGKTVSELSGLVKEMKTDSRKGILVKLIPKAKYQNLIDKWTK